MLLFIKKNIQKIFLFAIFILHPSFGTDNYEEKATKIEGLDHIKERMKFIDTSMPDDPSWWKGLWPNPKDVVNSLGLESDMISVDLCCGYGYFTPFLAQLSSKVYAIDLDNELLEQARMENPSIKNCVWIQGDAMDITNLIPEKVNFVFLANTLHGVPDKEKLGKNIFSILEEGGKLGIVNWQKKRQEETILFGLPTGPKLEIRMDLYELDSILQPLGFSLNKVVDLPPHHYGAIFIKNRK